MSASRNRDDYRNDTPFNDSFFLARLFFYNTRFPCPVENLRFGRKNRLEPRLIRTVVLGACARTLIRARIGQIAAKPSTAARPPEGPGLRSTMSDMKSPQRLPQKLSIAFQGLLLPSAALLTNARRACIVCIGPASPASPFPSHDLMSARTPARPIRCLLSGLLAAIAFTASAAEPPADVVVGFVDMPEPATTRARSRPRSPPWREPCRSAA